MRATINVLRVRAGSFHANDFKGDYEEFLGRLSVRRTHPAVKRLCIHQSNHGALDEDIYLSEEHILTRD